MLNYSGKKWRRQIHRGQKEQASINLEICQVLVAQSFLSVDYVDYRWSGLWTNQVGKFNCRTLVMPKPSEHNIFSKEWSRKGTTPKGKTKKIGCQ